MQTDVFPHVQGATYLGRLCGSEGPFVSRELSEAFSSIAMQDSVDFSHRHVGDRIQRCLSGIEKKNDKIIVSSEEFSNNVTDRGLIAERLSRLFPDAKILIIIRNQMGALESMYSFLVPQMGKNINLSYGRPSVASFEEWIKEQEAFFCRSYILTLKYYEFISKYWSLFGKENVTIGLFEDLVESPESFFGRVAGFLDVEALELPKADAVPRRNQRPTGRELGYYKLIGRFPKFAPSNYVPQAVAALGRKFLKSDFGNWRGQYCPVEVKDRLICIYREGNEKLSEELGIDLSERGYIC